MADSLAADSARAANNETTTGIRTGAKDPVRLAVVDIDGCLTPGVASEWNWDALQAVGALNRRAQREENVPAVTLCTGRQEPYMEVLMQAISAFQPGIYEYGGGLYYPSSFRFRDHPDITADARAALADAKTRAYKEVVSPGLGYLQPGKEVSISLFPSPGVDIGDLYQVVWDLFDGDSRLLVQHSAACVDITPAGIDKGAGVRWLSQETAIPLAQMGGIGDSLGDLTFLRLVGRSAAPANAADRVKAEVDYVSEYENGDGVVDILSQWSTGS
jgi:hydroxymethylpyrimidine pyrophosphatase-like HAD family hydrolase